MKTHHDQAITSGDTSPLFTCIRLGTKTEEPFTNASSPHQQRQAKDINEDSEAEDIWQLQLGNYRWGPFECSQPWTPFYHTCQQSAHDSRVCGRTSSLSWATEWDQFEVLIQELERKQSDLTPTPAPTAVTDLPPGPTSPTRRGRFDAFGRRSPPTRLQDDRGSLKRDEGQPSVRTREGSRTSGGRDPVKAFPPTTLAPVHHRKTPTGEPEKGEAADGRRRLSMNSLESLYSLTSRQSSSSGVTSTSDYFSNRDSLRLDDDIFTKQYCGRARVHTDFVPSPYDTESLSLKVGDVIDIIAKPPMGTWTGKLRGKIGNFKFVYVDMLSDECPDRYQEPYSVRQKSTVREVLKRLSLEEYSSSLQLYGYQTVDDLMRLRERHLTELNVTDPEHRHRLLAAVRSLQELHSGDQSEANQEAEVPSKSSSGSTRDSGCHMPSDSSPEDGDLDLISQCSSPADVTAT